MKTLKKINIFVIFLFTICFQTFAGGFIVVTPPNSRPIPNFNPYQIEIRELKVTTQINEQAAKTTIEQIFYNPSAVALEGYFLFPVPQGAVISDFQMEVNGVMMPAELLDATKARQLYEDIVRQVLDPALLEFSENNVFKVRIFPLEAFKEKKIKISYTQLLPKDNNIYEYIFPLNIKKYTSKPLKSISLNITVHSENEIKTIYSPSHNTEIVRKDSNTAVVSYESENSIPNSDLKLYIGTGNQQIGASLLSYKTEEDDGFFLLDLAPGFGNSNDEVIEKDITFVLDVSGSMAGEKMEQAKKALLFCVENLNANDKFEIIKFSTEASALFQKREIATTENRKKAVEYINQLRSIGGTNVEEALQMALTEKPNEGRPHFIVFITDGKPTIGETNQELLLAKIKTNNTENIRIFTFGIGDDINTHLLDKITEETNAYRSYIAPNEDIEIAISNFYTKVNSPVLTNVKVTISSSAGVYEMFPKEIPDIFRGSSVTLMGRFKNEGRVTITVTGNVNGEDKVISYNTEFKAGLKYEFIPPLWATRNIGYLLDQIRLNGENKELVDEVVRLAKLYGIITPYTSFLILEDEAINISQNVIRPTDVIFYNRSSNSDFLLQNQAEYKLMEQEEGAGSVRSSSEVQNMRNVANSSQTLQGASRMVYTDRNGVEQNFANQVENIQGRAVYQNGNEWIDLYVQQQPDLQRERIKFASEEYFKLLNSNPEVSDFLSLGQNVRFVYSNKIYEIYE